jgi:hypothetical protein
MGRIGSLIDDLEDDGHMTPAPQPPRPNEPRQGTHAALVRRFQQEQWSNDTGRGTCNTGVLNSTLKALRDEGYPNREIQWLIVDFWKSQTSEELAWKTVDRAILFRAWLKREEYL